MNKNDKKVMFGTATDEYATPQWFYDKLNEIFDFTLDPCATDTNTKCAKYYTIDDDGLSKSWAGECVFVNMPYSKNRFWVPKCAKEGRQIETTVVALLPARVETKYAQEHIYPFATAVVMIKGRLKFGDAKTSAPFPSMLAIYRQEALKEEELLKLRELGSILIPEQEVPFYA